MGRATKENNLAVVAPGVAVEWHPTLNTPLLSNKVGPFSSKKVWWQCSEGHEWQAVISDRVAKKSRCPYCAGRRPSSTHNLQISYPKIAAEWHRAKNDPLLPTTVTPFSHKKVWWNCSEGHEWQAVVAGRSKNNTGCPYCSGRKASRSNNLMEVYPKLAQEWHPTKNGHLTSSDVTPSSKRKAWWICKRGHEWLAAVGTRAAGTGCPYCANKKVGPDNNLAVVAPKLAREWDAEKNQDITPDDVTPGSGRKVWWKCDRGHSWQAAVKDRMKGSGCPSCSPNTSSMEIRIYAELDYIFGNVVWQEKISGLECDVYLSDLRLGIEVDGYYWHKDKISVDLAKTKKLRKLGIDLVRVREPKLPQLSPLDILVNHKESQISVVKRLFQRIGEIRPEVEGDTIHYLGEGKFRNSKRYKSIHSNLPGPPPELSLRSLRPDLASQWHYQRNKPLTPEHFSIGSSRHKIWWQCKKGHEWQSTINNRTSGWGCPYCSGKLPSQEYNLLAVAPDIAAQWHAQKNGKLLASGVTPKSGRSAWWICSKGHEWSGRIGDRVRGVGCPYCSGLRTASEKSLARLLPDLAQQWHPTKNGNMTPHDVSLGSGKKVWWRCEEGHEWNVPVRYRVSGNKCPTCNSLEVKRPDLAAEIHPTKNPDLTAEQLSVSTGRKIWWQCSDGHEWQANVSNRSKDSGSGCPICAKLRRAH